MKRRSHSAREAFKEQLLSVMDQKNHWAWKHLSGPSAAKMQLRVHYQQEYEVYVRDFPIFLGRLHGKNPPPDVRRELAENLYEEETGGLSLGKSHPELFLKMMRGLGFRPSQFQKVALLPKSRRYRQWLDEVTQAPHWLDGVAVITIFVEGSIHDRKEIGAASAIKTDVEEVIRYHFLVRHHRLDPACLDLVRAHYQVERGHRIAAWEMVLNHAQSRDARQRVHDRIKKSLDLWMAYRDGVAEAAGILSSPDKPSSPAARKKLG